MEPTPPEEPRPGSADSQDSAESVAHSVVASVAQSHKGELPQLHEVVFEYEMFNGRRIKRRVNVPIRLDSPRLVRRQPATRCRARSRPPAHTLLHTPPQTSPLTPAPRRTADRSTRCSSRALCSRSSC